ncbi:DUF3783 domain-containing protein [Anaeromicropila herbilytica]|uniref:DUF3783 domain-containing protein n=1 Tax=Anaeromicropila herbilytica TaxID=2785025 RepID=A0A7R7EKT9_9FIRM|nr:DUF3783 domain-containing protein [Anaeromicropila herbilytica]BCN30627.1 hypothetical protein bsdtb5_19220 [Anaeromicropila herbilytica]
MEQSKILLYNLKSAKGSKIEKLCKRLSIEVKHVVEEEYLNSIGNLAGTLEKKEDNQLNGRTEEAFQDEMFIMVNFTDSLLDQFLKEYRKTHIDSVSLRAIMTPNNQVWNSYELYHELCRERDAMKAFE